MSLKKDYQSTKKGAISKTNQEISKVFLVTRVSYDRLNFYAFLGHYFRMIFFF